MNGVLEGLHKVPGIGHLDELPTQGVDYLLT